MPVVGKKVTNASAANPCMGRHSKVGTNGENFIRETKKTRKISSQRKIIDTEINCKDIIMRPKEKSEYVAATESVLGEIHADLHKALNSMKSHHLILLTKAISDRHSVQMPKFPTTTPAQKLRLYNILKEAKSESGTISTDTVSDE